MFKHFLSSSILFALCVSLVGGVTQAESDTPKAISTELGFCDFISLENLTEEILVEFMAGKMPNYAIEFPAQTQIPLHLYLEGDLATLVNTDAMNPEIRFNKTVFLRNQNGNFFLTSDLLNWKTFTQFLTGKLEVRLSAGDEEGLSMSLGAEINERISD